MLIEGRNQISHVIQIVTKSTWSHACLYIGKIEDIQNEGILNLIKSHYQGDLSEEVIIESEVGAGTIVSPLSKYKEDHIRLLRPQGLSKEDGFKVICYAAHRLGVKYSLHHIFDLARFLFSWSIYPRRCDLLYFNIMSCNRLRTSVPQ